MLTKQEIDKVRELHDQGFSLAKIAKGMKISTTTAQKYLRSVPQGQETENAALAVNDVDRDLSSRVFELLNQGKALTEIVVEVGQADEVERLAAKWRDMQEMEFGLSLEDMQQIKDSISSIEAGGRDLDEFIDFATECWNTKKELREAKEDLASLQLEIADLQNRKTTLSNSVLELNKKKEKLQSRVNGLEKNMSFLLAGIERLEGKQQQLAIEIIFFDKLKNQQVE